MFRTLWRDAPNGLTNLAPAGTRSPTSCGSFLTQAVCGASELIGKLQRGQACFQPVGHPCYRFFSPERDQPLHQRCQLCSHVLRLPATLHDFNHVLTTLC